MLYVPRLRRSAPVSLEFGPPEQYQRVILTFLSDFPFPSSSGGADEADDSSVSSLALPGSGMVAAPSPGAQFTATTPHDFATPPLLSPRWLKSVDNGSDDRPPRVVSGEVPLSPRGGSTFSFDTVGVAERPHRSGSEQNTEV